jgi:hypothetical protein
MKDGQDSMRMVETAKMRQAEKRRGNPKASPVAGKVDDDQHQLGLFETKGCILAALVRQVGSLG